MHEAMGRWTYPFRKEYEVHLRMIFSINFTILLKAFKTNGLTDRPIDIPSYKVSIVASNKITALPMQRGEFLTCGHADKCSA